MTSFTFPKLFNNWPKGIANGECKVLFHRIGKEHEIIHKWIPAKFRIDGRLHVEFSETPHLPDGIYDIPGILFFKNREHVFTANTPNDYTVSKIAFFGGNYEDATDEMVEKAINDWESQVTIGAKPKDDESHYGSHFICSDCLIKQSFRIGPAEIYPLSHQGIQELSNSIREFLLIRGIRDVHYTDVYKSVIKQQDKKTPVFCMSFPKVYYGTDKYGMILLPFIKKVFGLLSLNFGSYAKINGAVFIKHDQGGRNVGFDNLNSYYRGNLFGTGSLFGKFETINAQYDKIKDSNFKTEILEKLNSAQAETDLDMAYFRLWAILESVSNDLFSRKDLKTIKKLIKIAYAPMNVEQTIHLKLGDTEYSFSELVNMWHDWRDCTAHHGGIFAHDTGMKKIHGKTKQMINEMRKLQMPVVFGEDRSLFILKDVCNMVLKKYIAGEIKNP